MKILFKRSEIKKKNRAIELIEQTEKIHIGQYFYLTIEGQHTKNTQIKCANDRHSGDEFEQIAGRIFGDAIGEALKKYHSELRDIAGIEEES